MLAVIASFVRCLFASRSCLQLENLALRHQLSVYQRSVRRPKLRDRDRLLWSMLSRVVAGWRDLLFIARPGSVPSSVENEDGVTSWLPNQRPERARRKRHAAVYHHPVPASHPPCCS